MRDIITNSFASKRTLREGSVGLLILLGLGAFVMIVLWLNRFTAGTNSYKFIVEFANAGGMQRGAPVRYRGVKVGNISKLKAGSNAVEVEIEIAPADLMISRDAVIEANQSGLISESIIDITPKNSIPAGEAIAKPLDNNCDDSLIVCNGSRLQGKIGISIDELIRTSTNLATTYNDPQFYQRLNRLLESSTAAATGVASLTQDFQVLSKSFQQQLGTFSTTANSVQQSTNKLTVSATKTVDQLGATASEFSATANQASRLLSNLDELVTTNRSSLVGALNNITETSNQLRVTVSSLSPAVNQLTQGELLNNLETLSANAAQASANLRDASKTLNDPQNLVLMQQTLDSARVTFENTQKITSDLDELTGDPAFRQNLLQLVNGLSGLVSSTEQMQQDVKVAATLDSLKTAVTKPAVKQLPVKKPFVKKPPVSTPKIELPTPNPPKQQALNIKPIPAAVDIFEPNPQPIVNPTIPESSQDKLLQQLRQYGEERNLDE
ncbi:MlaD family protein [Nodularia spumigena]|uniref:MlaD family protein n=1 Tax=Nodularia spumigena TaxID=70799 RepID=UPI00232D861D|nr:MlaD family protein [Nodularia spumigena]MDB9349166.1 MlaD family protein [Nodularia spumigena CS-588/01]MDB9352215.1 MlaD family protein [Nodularia spumigena CS-588/05]